MNPVHAPTVSHAATDSMPSPVAPKALALQSSEELRGLEVVQYASDVTRDRAWR